MSPDRLIIEGDLNLLSQLHVGSGTYVEREDLVAEDDRREGQTGARLALINRDAALRPYIPGATIKGVLRALCRNGSDVEDAQICLLFGNIKAEDGTGQIGRLTAYGAACTSPRQQVALPMENNGEFVSARSAIDGASGTAERNKLYYQEMVSPGAKFRLQLRFSPLGDAKADGQALALLRRVLSTISSSQGFALGKGRADGQGAIRLATKTLKIVTERLNDNGEISRREWPAADFLNGADPINPPSKRFSLSLNCDSPFFINDWSHRPPPRQPDGTPAGPQLKAQRQGPRIPELPGASLSGVLRSRAQWLKGILDLRAQQRFSASGPGPKCPVERLFGTEGWAALLRVDSIRPSEASTKQIASVRIDRFSAAPIDGALFSVDAFVSPRFELMLSLDCAGGRLSEADEEFATLLIDDIRNKGLAIGHATNRGFGWFEVEDRSLGCP